ncbi:MAG: haloacid dehalogenase-like hydrolase [Flavobacteriales bacterium]|nr:haloacid dehalogenase-like hydrolase [Flavobacteriales bacterium]
MKLLIFDIDGTLTNSTNVDDECYVKAFYATFKIDLLPYLGYDMINVTDWGIAEEVFQGIHNRSISNEELMELRENFVGLLKSACDDNPEVYSPVPGSLDFLKHLERNDQYEIAIATGSWSDSAAVKLGALGYDYENIPFSNCDLFISREEIVKDAISKSKAHYGLTSFHSITYFGDGLWDYKTCKNIDVPFVGIDVLKNGKLKEAGADHVFENYLNIDSILDVV